MKKNKIKIIIIIVLILIISAPFIFAVTDYILVKNGYFPIFSKESTMIKDGGTIIYSGLGYYIIEFNATMNAPDEDGKGKCEIYDEVKIYSWFNAKTVDDNYNEEIMKKREELDNKLNQKRFAKLKQLPKNYTLEQAINDKCVISVEGEKVYNKEKLDKINNLSDWDEFVRCVDYMKNGDIRIVDVYNNNGTHAVYFDFSRVKNRDKFENDDFVVIGEGIIENKKDNNTTKIYMQYHEEREDSWNAAILEKTILSYNNNAEIY